MLLRNIAPRVVVFVSATESTDIKAGFEFEALFPPFPLIFSHVHVSRPHKPACLNINRRLFGQRDQMTKLNRSSLCGFLKLSFSWMFILLYAPQCFPLGLKRLSLLPDPLLVSPGQSQRASLLRHRHPDPEGPVRPSANVGAASWLGGSRTQPKEVLLA